MVVRAVCRHIIAFTLGGLSGIAWGSVTALFEPKLIEEMPEWIAVVILLSPILTVGLCSRCFAWWTGSAQLLFSIGLVCCWAVFDWYDFHMAAEFIDWTGPIVMYFVGVLLLIAVWAIGRATRKRSIEYRN